MKVVYPVGRGVSKLDTGANYGVQPRGCICSSGNNELSVGYACADCACECEHGDNNRDANYEIADTKRNYVNIG